MGDMTELPAKIGKSRYFKSSERKKKKRNIKEKNIKDPKGA
jgi:hypothetical protein